MLFTDAPLSAATLLRRLERYRFFERKVLPLGIARNALQAAQTVEQQKLYLQTTKPDLESRTSVISQKRSPSLNVLKHPDPAAILDRIYAHPGIQAHFSEMWRDLLLARPRAPISTQIKLLQSVSSNRKQSPDLLRALYACLRVNLADRHFIPSFKLLDLAPELTPKRTIAQVVGLTCVGLGSCSAWISFPLVALMYPVFYMGFIAAIVSAATPQQSLVQFDPVHTTWWYRIKNKHQLHMANMIVTEFQETGTITAANYHRQFGRTEAPDTLYRALVTELKQRRILMRNTLTTAELMYADYWSPHYHRWQNVEWKEPDQDPAELLEQERRQPASKRTKLLR